jgi:hypothetical protein
VTALQSRHWRAHRVLEDSVAPEAVLDHQNRTGFVDREDQCRVGLQQKTSLKRCR